MSRSGTPWMLIVLVPILSARVSGQQSVYEPMVEPLPSPEVVIPRETQAMPSVATPVEGEGVESVTEPRKKVLLRMRDFWGYRTAACQQGWTVGDGDQFGRFSFGPRPYLAAGVQSGITAGVGIELLSGPQRTDMPPRLYEFSIGYQKRDIIGKLAYDLSAHVTAASDFEGSSRDGFLFPAHAVGYLAWTDDVDIVLGAEYLSRDDVRVLPVVGLIMCLDPDIRIELVFPRPRLELQLTPEHRLYCFGQLGGGTWSVERDSELDDLVSLYELEAGVGWNGLEHDGAWGGVELACLFDRKLEYRSAQGNYQIGPTLLIRAVKRY